VSVRAWTNAHGCSTRRNLANFADITIALGSEALTPFTEKPTEPMSETHRPIKVPGSTPP
jgi:hypothetical protein